MLEADNSSIQEDIHRVFHEYEVIAVAFIKGLLFDHLTSVLLMTAKSLCCRGHFEDLRCSFNSFVSRVTSDWDQYHFLKCNELTNFESKP